MLPYSTSALLLLIILLVHSSVLSCRIGTQSECDAAPFVPSHNLVGGGFDIVTLQRKTVDVFDVKTYLGSKDTCILCSNPLQNDMSQKLPYSVVAWSASPCSPDIISSYHTSAGSLMNNYMSHVTHDGTFGLEITKSLLDKFDVGGTHSDVYKFISKNSKEDRHTYSLHTVTCKHYEFILPPTPPFSIEFKKQLNILPSHYNSSTMKEYVKFIKTYGTHFFRMVNLGGRLRRLISSPSRSSSMNGLASSEAHSCLSMGVAVGLGKMKISSVKKSCLGVLKSQNSADRHQFSLRQHYTEVSGGNGWLGKFSISKNDSKAYKKWLMSLKEHPDVISYSLRPLYQLVINTLQKAGLKTAIEKYLEEHALKKLPQEPYCQGKISNLSSNCCPANAPRGTLSVTIVRAWNLKGDMFGVTDGYAKMFYGSIYHKTNVIKSDNPQWNAQYYLGKVDTSMVLKIEVWDKDWINDDLLVKCGKYLSSGSHTFTCKSTLGKVEVKYTLICDPYLTG